MLNSLRKDDMQNGNCFINMTQSKTRVNIHNDDIVTLYTSQHFN